MFQRVEGRSCHGRTLVAWLLAAAYIVCADAHAAGRDIDKWKSARLELSDHVLTFRYPGGHSRDFPESKPLRKADIENDALYGSFHYFVPFEQFWDYRGFFWQGVFGTLSMKVLVYRRPVDFEAKLSDHESLRALIEAIHRAGHEKFRARWEGKLEIPALELPTNYEPAGQDRGWLRYSDHHATSGATESVMYARPLDEDHYLSIGFHFIDNSRGKRTEWRQWAESVLINVMATLKLDDSEFGVGAHAR